MKIWWVDVGIDEYVPKLSNPRDFTHRCWCYLHPSKWSHQWHVPHTQLILKLQSLVTLAWLQHLSTNLTTEKSAEPPTSPWLHSVSFRLGGVENLNRMRSARDVQQRSIVLGDAKEGLREECVVAVPLFNENLVYRYMAIDDDTLYIYIYIRYSHIIFDINMCSRKELKMSTEATACKRSSSNSFLLCCCLVRLWFE